MCVSLCLTVSELSAQDTLIVKLSLRTTDFSFGTQDGYDVIIPKHKGMGQISIPSHPQLPTWHPAYIIPYWKDIAYCEIVALDSVQIPGTYNIYPAQVEVPIGDSADWTPPDSAIYNSDSLYPGKFQESPGSGSFDGARIAALSLYPMAYRPKSGRLFLYTEATPKLVFKDSEPPINAKQRYAHVQETYDQLLSALVENDGDIGAWYRRPAIIDPNEGKYTPPPAFIIVTTANQIQYVQPYADWMYQKGYPAQIKDIAWVLANYSGVDPAEKIRNYVIAQYRNGVSYFLFLGHEDDVPYRKLGPVASQLANWNQLWEAMAVMPSDLYFSEVDVNWNPNGDGYWGVYDPLDLFGGGEVPPEHDGLMPTDVIPEVFVGRVLAYTDPVDADPNEVANWVAKALNYEKNPGNTSGMKNVLHSYDPMFDAGVTDAETHFPPDFTHTEVTTSAGTLYEINNHYYGWMNTLAHGRWNKCWILSWDQNGQPDDRFFSSSYWGEPDLGDLTNQNAYFIHYSISCLQTCYDDYYYLDDPGVTDTSIGEGFVEAYPSKGAVASFTNTRLGLEGNDTIRNRFMDAVFDDSIWFLGAALTQAKATDPPNNALYRGFYSRYTVNLFGSPPTEAWTDVPVTTFTSVALKSIPVGVPKTITVTVKYQNGPFQSPLPGARVTLYGCGVYKVGTTGSDGKKTFYSVIAETPGTILATATKHNFLPSWDNITVTGKGDMAVSEKGAPLEFFISLASSNPVRGDLKLRFGIPFEDEGLVSLKIYDVSGRVVQMVFSEEKSAGYYDLAIPVSSLSTGTYFLMFENRNKARTEKVIKGGE